MALPASALSGQRKRRSPGLGESGHLSRPLHVLPQAGGAEQKCKDGLSAVTGMEPAGTWSHPVPASSHIVMDEGQEPAPDLCPRGRALLRAARTPGGRGVELLNPTATALEPSRGLCQGHSVDILMSRGELPGLQKPRPAGTPLHQTLPGNIGSQAA